MNRDTILAAVAALMHHRFDVTGEFDKSFEGLVVDLYLPAPLNCIVQYDDARHCTRQRALTFADYPADAPLNFDVRRYRADQEPGDTDLARQDVLIDLLPAKHGLNPTVRIRHDEVAELPGTLEERLAAILARRFAYHAGTTFHLMLENAGAKPHRTL
ncbi:MAG: hypothetical protein PCFJNLEI_01747 [Verrucomicrobiae bacterium]|nr:hypothetical protein [Verrucomicrobiae bacterium]